MSTSFNPSPQQKLWIERWQRFATAAVRYFHVVFTLPHQLGPLALQNPRIVYGILFRAVAETLLELGQRRLAARFGFLAVLHTWGQTLGHHAHLHCIVPGGGIALDGSRWVRCKGRRFFL
ncbi:MAG: transposase, partial [Proteobacteria bacterium]|nr:transposase [Pseudomonadota bacterium]